MIPHHGEPRSNLGLDTAPDRRRPDRSSDVNPQLVPLLRGQMDPAAPADPVLPPPRPALSRDLLLGSAVAAALYLAGVAVRFAL